MLILKTSLMKKIRTNDLSLEINKVSIEDDTNNKESEHDHIMVTQSRDPNNKSTPAYKTYCSFCHKNNIMVFQIVIKNNAMKNIKDIKIRDQELTSVRKYFRSKPSNSHENRKENKNESFSKDNDRNRYNQNNYSYYNDRYRNNDRY